MRDSTLPADEKDVSFALRRGTIAQVTKHHHLALDGCAYAGYACAAAQREALVRRG
jgi:hypothetical protein